MDKVREEDFKSACRSVHEFLDGECKLIEDDPLMVEILGFSILMAIIDAKIRIIKDSCKEAGQYNMLKEILSEIYIDMNNMIEKNILTIIQITAQKI